MEQKLRVPQQVVVMKLKRLCTRLLDRDGKPAPGGGKRLGNLRISAGVSLRCGQGFFRRRDGVLVTR
jgi:hypothetical protein